MSSISFKHHNYSNFLDTVGKRAGVFGNKKKVKGLDEQSGSSASKSIGPSSLSAQGCQHLSWTWAEDALWCSSSPRHGTADSFREQVPGVSQEELLAADASTLSGLCKVIALWCLLVVPRRSSHLPILSHPRPHSNADSRLVLPQTPLPSEGLLSVNACKPEKAL